MSSMSSLEDHQNMLRSISQPCVRHHSRSDRTAHTLTKTATHAAEHESVTTNETTNLKL